MQIIETIKKDIDWYNSSYNKATIEQLMDCKSRIVTNNFYLADLVADYNMYQLQLDNEKKAKYARIRHELIKDSYAVNKAEIKAENEIKNERAEYVENKHMFDRLKLLHNQVNEICQDIQQRVAILRKEKEQ